MLCWLGAAQAQAVNATGCENSFSYDNDADGCAEIRIILCLRGDSRPWGAASRLLRGVVDRDQGDYNDDDDNGTTNDGYPFAYDAVGHDVLETIDYCDVLRGLGLQAANAEACSWENR